MNRRGFLNTIARVAAAASLSPTIFIPKFEPVRWKTIWQPRRGKFIAEFKTAIYPLTTEEFSFMIFHVRRPTIEIVSDLETVNELVLDWKPT